LLTLLTFGLTVSGSPLASAATPDEDAAPKPPMGWSTSSLGCAVNEQQIREGADALVSSGMKAAGYQYVIVDACWQSARDAGGGLVADPERFPSGMKALADYVHARGLKFVLQLDSGELACQRRSPPAHSDDSDARQLAAWRVDTPQSDWCAAAVWKEPDLPRLGKAAGNADEYRTYMSLWTLLGVPLIAGIDVRGMDAGTRSMLLNRQVLAVHQDSPGQPGRRLRRVGDLDIWVRPLSDGGWAILMLNRGPTELPAKLDWTELGLPPRGSLLLRDLWTGRNVGRERGGYAVTLAPHTSQLLRAVP